MKTVGEEIVIFERKDLYFTITSKKYKMFILHKKQIKNKRLYDLMNDKNEVNNLTKSKKFKKRNSNF